MRSETVRLHTGDRLVTALTDVIAAFLHSETGDGVLHVFAPHATAGIALLETGSGSEADLERAIDRLLPRDDRYDHRHGSAGHGADHVLPAFISPSVMVPVIGGSPQLGRWQSVVFVDPNRDNPERSIVLSFVAA